MPLLDLSSRDRLERLRATDVTGVYASDDPSHGTDPTGSVTVTIDPTLRATLVRIESVERVRSPEQLAHAVGAAYSAALSARFAGPDDANADDPPPGARRVRLQVRPIPDLVARHQAGRQTTPRPRRRVPREEVGTSVNGCVTVTLPVFGPRGRADADAGWLRQANGAQVGAAVTEAFHDAYSRRDS